MVGNPLNAAQVEALKREVENARAVGAIPITSLVTIVGNWLWIIQNFDLE